jgi:polyisoprenoid-binding protein YceI
LNLSRRATVFIARFVFAAVLLALSVPRASAQSPAAQKITVHFDPALTEIHWTLTGNAHDTHGIFKLKGGVVSYDPATGAAQGELLVDVTSGESGDKKRDAKMQNDVLESNKFPEAFFHPVKIEGAVKPGTTQTISVGGTFNIHGADHPLKLEIHLNLNGTQATATTHFSVPYVAWGMKDPSNFILRVGKEVAVDVVAHGSIEGLPTESTTSLGAK